MFCLSEAALLDSITGRAAPRLLVKATGAWPTWCLLLRLSALLPGFLHGCWARWLKPPLKPHAAVVNTGQGTARGNSQRRGQERSVQRVLCVPLRGWQGHSPAPAPALLLPQQHLSYKSFSLAPRSTSHPRHRGWLVLLPQMPAGCAMGT